MGGIAPAPFAVATTDSDTTTLTAEAHGSAINASRTLVTALR
jgi:hypothetical protein